MMHLEQGGGYPQASMTKIIIVAGHLMPVPPNWRATFRMGDTPMGSLEGARLKIKRADQHIKDIENILRDFGDSHSIFREMEPDGIHEAVKLRVNPIPEMLPVIIGEAIFQLRSALDLLAIALPKAAGVTNNDHIIFPFASKKTKAKEFEKK
jgi:hypothetical protein